MIYNYLGKTKIKVSKICFGALTIGPLQANLPLSNGIEIIKLAQEMGVNFVDTAEIYGTYKYLKPFKDMTVATKTYAYTKEGAKKSFEKARFEMDRDVIDIFLLHEQESELTIKGHFEALEFLLKQKEKNNIRAVGISTHHISACKAALKFPEIDIVHPLINLNGIGIADGTRHDMERSIRELKQKGVGIYLMKAIGGGNLISNINAALDYAFSLEFADSVAIGMQSLEEVIYNINYLNKLETHQDVIDKLKKQNRKLHIESWCEGCGKCVKLCKSKALKIKNGMASPNPEDCVLCGYCSRVCDSFAIKII